MTERYLGVSDNGVTFLTSAVNDTDTTISVDDASVFSDATLPFAATIVNEFDESEMEIVLVTSIAGNDLTVERGYKFTAVAHGANSRIHLRVIAQHVADLNDSAVARVHQDCFVEYTRNATNQIISAIAWEDNSKTLKLADATYTYATVTDQNPTSAVRQIYKSDGTTVRRTETATFVYTAGRLTSVERVVT